MYCNVSSRFAYMPTVVSTEVIGVDEGEERYAVDHSRGVFETANENPTIS